MPRAGALTQANRRRQGPRRQPGTDFAAQLVQRECRNGDQGNASTPGELHESETGSLPRKRINRLIGQVGQGAMAGAWTVPGDTTLTEPGTALAVDHGEAIGFAEMRGQRQGSASFGIDRSATINRFRQ